jgi:dihydroorotate dehydrogenase electron transfer subunit
VRTATGAGAGNSAARGRFISRVVANRAICQEHFLLTVAVEGFPRSVPGQFLQIDCTAPGAEENPPPAAHPIPFEIAWSPTEGAPAAALHDPDLLEARAFLRRPFSIGGRRDGASGRSELDVIYRVIGKGTRHLESLVPGGEVSLLGPLGHGFVIPDDLDEALLVGGGVGIPPMLYLAEALHQRGKTAVAFIGAQRATLLPIQRDPAIAPPSGTNATPTRCVTDFARYGFPSVITTDDGSLGLRGFVTQALDTFLAGPKAGKRIVYCCGPTPMMRATAAVCARHGVVCQVSLEQPMACGMGTCQSCVIRWKPNIARAEWVYKLTCTDGPVFEAREIVWDREMR